MFLEINDIRGVILDLDGFIHEQNGTLEERRNFKDIYQFLAKYPLAFVSNNFSETQTTDFLRTNLGMNANVFTPKPGTLESGFFRGPILRARDSLSLPSCSVVFVSANPTNISEASAARLGTVLVSESAYEQAERDEIFRHCPDFELDTVQDLEGALTGKLLGFAAEVDSVHRGYFKNIFPKFSGQQFVNHIETTLPIETNYPEIKIHFLGRYLDVHDHRHKKHALSQKILNSKKYPERHAPAFAKIYWKWTQHLAEDVDLITAVPCRPGELDRFKVILDKMPPEAKKHLASHLLVCPNSYPKQKGLNAQQRRENVRGKFALNSTIDVKGKIVVVIDDVFTTGSSILECTKILLDGGAKKVVPLCLSFHVFPPAIATDKEIPCPKCKNPMVVRIRKSDGAPFFSCSKYHDAGCKGAINFEEGVRILNELGNPDLSEVEKEIPLDIDF